MATVNAASGATAASQTQTKQPQDAFGKDAFMKILVEQLKHQSPDDKSDPNAFIGQMTQFSMLEQMQQQTAVQTKSQAAAYVGRTASYLTATGQSGTGTVESVDFSGTEPTFTIGDQIGIIQKDILEVS